MYVGEFSIHKNMDDGDRSRSGGGGYEQIYLRNVECVMSVRRPHRASGKYCVYGMLGCT